MNVTVNPRVTLVGAGPGDPDLITLKGILALNTADVVLYDALVDPALLHHAPASAMRIYVGKRVGKHSQPQQDTNELCVLMAQQYGHVVRLKGGDPFVFGRGAEELDYISGFGIPTQVVPGISSAVAVPASAGIPVTKRGVCESFWVITGTTSSGQLSQDVALAAKSSATVVILMGTRKLPEIVDVFAKEGKSQLPIAIIQRGTTQDEVVTAGLVSNILEKSEKTKVDAPAIIVLGEVVRESLKLAEVYQLAVGQGQA